MSRRGDRRARHRPLARGGRGGRPPSALRSRGRRSRRRRSPPTWRRRSTRRSTVTCSRGRPSATPCAGRCSRSGSRRRCSRSCSRCGAPRRRSTRTRSRPPRSRCGCCSRSSAGRAACRSSPRRRSSTISACATSPRACSGSASGSHTDDAVRIAAHPLVGAYHLATVLGAHPAVAAAQAHHWRCGQGYPTLARAPSRSIEVISVASTFAALTQPRAFRPARTTPAAPPTSSPRRRSRGHADTNTVKLLVHALRGGRGDPRSIRFGRERGGHGPDANRYVHVAAPARSPV